MKKFYFTFGTDLGFPYQGGWVEVYADDLNMAIEKFRNKFPDRHKNTVNCAFWYTEEQFKKSFMNSNLSEHCWEVIQ